MKNKPPMKKLLLATLAVTVGCFNPAHAGNTINDHNDLWQAVEEAGVDVQTNHPKYCKDSWGGGYYANYRDGSAVMMICQDKGKGVGHNNQSNWTPNDLDTLRHEAHHLIQDCKNGARDGDLVPYFDKKADYQAFIRNNLTVERVEWIVETYGKDGASSHTILLELEAFAVAEDVQASSIATEVSRVCSAPKFTF